MQNSQESIRGSLRLLKLDEYSGDTPLCGAAFRLYRLDEKHGKFEPIMENLHTGEDGTLLVENLPIGKYKFLETAAPFGYHTKGEEIYAEIYIDPTGTVISPPLLIVYNSIAPNSRQVRRTNRGTCCPRCGYRLYGGGVL